jgi:hypothetical protein
VLGAAGYGDVEAEWLTRWHRGWSRHVFDPEQRWEQLLSRLSVAQRTVLGFPPPGHRFWTAATVEMVEARYRQHEIDMGPYRAALRGGDAARL